MSIQSYIQPNVPPCVGWSQAGIVVTICHKHCTPHLTRFLISFYRSSSLLRERLSPVSYDVLGANVTFTVSSQTFGDTSYPTEWYYNGGDLYCSGVS